MFEGSEWGEKWSFMRCKAILVFKINLEKKGLILLWGKKERKVALPRWEPISNQHKYGIWWPKDFRHDLLCERDRTYQKKEGYL